MPTISAGALKRMLGLPANVVAGVPRVEKDPRGGDVVIVPVRPYARDMDRCARCGERGRPVFCQIFVGRFGVSFSPFERLFLGRFGFGQSCGLSVIA